MRDVVCNDEGCELEESHIMGVSMGGGANEASMSGSTGLAANESSYLIPLSGSSATEKRRGRKRQRKSQVGGRRSRTVKRSRRVTKKPVQIGGRRRGGKHKGRKQKGGKKIQIGGKRRRGGVKQKRVCVPKRK